MDNLPHAGGVTVALLQSIADVWLFLALSRRVHWALALAMCLLIASAPFDIAISSGDLESAGSGGADQDGDGDGAAADAGLTAVAGRRRRRCSRGWRFRRILSAAFVAAPLLSPPLAIRPFYERSDGRSTVVRRSARRSPIDRSRRSFVVLQVPFFISVLQRACGAGGAHGGDRRTHQPDKPFRPWFAFDSVTGITGNLRGADVRFASRSRSRRSIAGAHRRDRVSPGPSCWSR